MLIGYLAYWWSYRKAEGMQAQPAAPVGTSSKERKRLAKRTFLNATKTLVTLVDDKEQIVVLSSYTLGQQLMKKLPQHCDLILQDRAGQCFYHHQRLDTDPDLGTYWEFHDKQTLAEALASVERNSTKESLREQAKAKSIQAKWQTFLEVNYLASPPQSSIVVLMARENYIDHLAQFMSDPKSNVPIQIFSAEKLDQELQADGTDLSGLLFFIKHR